MKFSAWARFPCIDANPLCFTDTSSLIHEVLSTPSLIPFGNGRSYGDSALAVRYLPMRSRDRMLAFDECAGLLTCEAGVMLSEIVAAMLPKGWFLKVTPGTKHVTIGGAIASDVHGKNHHVAGCFSECVEDIRVLLPTGEIRTCGKGDELFHATCGGMGLTGVVLDARISLQKVWSSTIEQCTVKTQNLHETFEAFEQFAAMPYSVAWVDCLARGGELGRGLLMAGDFARDGELACSKRTTISVPFDLPSFVLNRRSAGAFNWLYYHGAPAGVSRRRVNFDAFFYPLDAVGDWNRLYGKAGFVQYQCIFPREASLDGLTDLLGVISRSGKGSFLAVLKLCGKANPNYLSFPLEGYSLALDFKMEKDIFLFLDLLDQIVLRHGGRIYLTKDARVGREVFERGYPDIERFRSFRKKYGMDEKFNSIQSGRLGL